MKTKYKNQIFQTLLSHPLGVDNFLIENQNRYLRVTYLPFDGVFKFDFMQSEDSLDLFYCEAILYRLEFRFHRLNTESDFTDNLERFKRWLVKDLAEFIEDKKEIDLYEEYKKNAANKELQQIDYQDHTNFTANEKSQILLGINELKLIMLDKFVTNDNDKEIIAARLLYLTEATNRIENKTDWKGIFINTFIAMCIALSLDTARGNELYQLFMNVLNIVPLLHQ